MFRLKSLLSRLVIALLLAVVGAVVWIEYVTAPKRFSRNGWIEGDERIRGQMAFDLVDRDLLRGKSRAEVVALLGKPSAEIDGYAYYKVSIGHSGLLGWKHMVMIRFDEQDRVIEERVDD